MIELTRLPDSEYAERLRRLRAELDAQDVALGLVYGNEFVPGDVQYLTGYDPQIEAAAVLVTRDTVAVLGGPEGHAMFRDQNLSGDWYNYQVFEVPYQDYGSLKFSTLSDILDGVGSKDISEVLLLTSALYTPHKLVTQFQDLGIRVRDGANVLSHLRYHKSALELNLFARSSAIATQAVEEMMAALKPGATELDVAAVGDQVMKSSGAYTSAWDTMVLSGRRINSVIGRASNKRIEQDELVLIGACPRYAGYASAVGRTLVAGQASPRQRHFIRMGARALELAAERLFEGGPAAQVDTAARSYLTTEGFGNFHAYGVGHGIGLSECLEERTATRLSDYSFPRSIAVSLDVGIFGNDNGLNGRFEDPYVITPDGRTERLTELPVLPPGL